MPFLFVSVLFASLVASTHPVRADSTESISYSSGVTLFSPLNKTYNSQFLTLNFSFACGWGIQYSLNYSIDGKYEDPIPLVPKNPQELHVVNQASGLIELPELSEGSHCLTIYVEADLNDVHSANPPGAPFKPTNPEGTNYAASWVHLVYFTIDPNGGTPDSTPPNVTILSPLNKTYTVANITTAKIPLDFTVDGNVSQVAFSLDGQDGASIAGNTTLTGLSIGPHNVTVYAQDLAGNTGASTVNFTVTAEPEPQPEPESFPTTLVATASGASTAIIGFGLLVYFKKRKY